MTPILVFVCIAIFIAGLTLAMHKSGTDKAEVYAKKHRQLVSTLDRITKRINHISETTIFGTKDPRLFDQFERILRMLETLIQAITKLDPIGIHPKSLDPAEYLAQDVEKRVESFERSLKGHEKSSFFRFKKRALPLGCYFCSRPIVFGTFSKVRVRVDGIVQEVDACSVCEKELKSNRKIRVLHFKKGGETIHWSKFKEYIPAEKFWSLNNRKKAPSKQKLELVTDRKKDDGSNDFP